MIAQGASEVYEFGALEVESVAALTAQPLPDLGPLLVSGSASTGELAFATLRAQFGRVLTHEAGTRLAEDAAHLHDMRVALRRMRSALKMFRDVLPARVVRLGRELAWLSGRLGEVRDLDVLLGRLEPWRAALDPLDRPALEPLGLLLSRRHAVARTRLLAALDSKRCLRLIERVSRELRRGPGRSPAAGQKAAAIMGREILVRRHKSLIKHTRSIDGASPADRHHRLRIRCKALRYALEAHVALWGSPARRMIRATIKLQDLLGAHQDAEVAVRELRRFAAGPALPRPTLFVVGGICERCSAEARAVRGGLEATLAELRGPRWRRLRRTMEQQARQAARAPARRVRAVR